MILIQRGKEPDSLLKYRKSSQQACYEELPGEAGYDIRRQMWEEQGGLCAYCMRQIKRPEDVRIEHYNARHSVNREYNPTDTLDFKKMLGVCYGNSIWPGTPKEDRTCDAHRGNIPLTVNPYNVYSIRKICYTSDGYITSEDEEIRKDVQETLNLNCHASSLPENRKRVLLQTKMEIRNLCKNKSHEVYLAILNKLYRRYTKERNLSPYCGITIAWLEKELGIHGNQTKLAN